jgi:hypothetical protein
MKKLLVLPFALFILFSGTKVFAAQGVDCQNIKFPNLSKLGFELKNEKVYEDSRLGISRSYLLSPGHTFTYYSFDNGHDYLNQKVLDSELASGVRHIIERHKIDPQLDNFQFQDDATYLKMDKFNEFGMQEFVNQGVYMTSKGDVLSGVSTVLDIITIGTDGKCIYKVRSTRFIPFLVETNLEKLLQDFEYVLIQFYQYNAIFKQTNS